MVVSDRNLQTSRGKTPIFRCLLLFCYGPRSPYRPWGGSAGKKPLDPSFRSRQVDGASPVLEENSQGGRPLKVENGWKRQLLPMDFGWNKTDKKHLDPFKVPNCRCTDHTLSVWAGGCIPAFLDGILDMDVSENSGTPKSSILIGFSIINHPFWGTPIFGNIHMLQSCEVIINFCHIFKKDGGVFRQIRPAKNRFVELPLEDHQENCELGKAVIFFQSQGQLLSRKKQVESMKAPVPVKKDPGFFSIKVIEQKDDKIYLHPFTLQENKTHAANYTAVKFLWFKWAFWTPKTRDPILMSHWRFPS